MLATVIDILVLQTSSSAEFLSHWTSMSHSVGHSISATVALNAPPSLRIQSTTSPPGYFAFSFLFGFFIAPPVLAMLGLWNRSGVVLKATGLLAIPGSIYVFGSYDYYFVWGLFAPVCIFLAGFARPSRPKLAAALVGLGLAFPLSSMIFHAIT